MDKNNAQEHTQQEKIDEARFRAKFPFYDYDKRECRECGILLPPDGEFLKDHLQDQRHIVKKLEREFGSQKREVKMDNTQAIDITSTKDIAPTLIGTLEETERRYKQLQEFVKKQMVDKEDYGAIPGCPKPSLFKAGAEKLLEIYGYAVSDISVINKVEDWEKGFFHYEIKAIATSKRSGQVVGTGIGSCNSKEKKYINQDPYSLVNTLMKMAKKRAVVDLALLVTRSSGIFTQDIEDMDANGDGKPAPVKHTATTTTAQDGKTTVTYSEETPSGGCTEKQQKAIYAILKGKMWTDEQIGEMLGQDYGVTHSRELTKAQASEVIDKYGKK